jgi:hypothetical protein
MSGRRGRRTKKRRSDMTDPISLTRDDIERVVGPVPDDLAVAIIETRATLEDLEVAEQWASQADDVMGKLRHPLTGAAAAVYDLLLAEEAFEEPRRAG